MFVPTESVPVTSTNSATSVTAGINRAERKSQHVELIPPFPSVGSSPWLLVSTLPQHECGHIAQPGLEFRKQ